MGFSFVYAAIGRVHCAYALRSIETLRRKWEGDIQVFTDRPKQFTNVRTIEVGLSTSIKDGRRTKTQLFQLAECETGVVLDADTLVNDVAALLSLPSGLCGTCGELPTVESFGNPPANPKLAAAVEAHPRHIRINTGVLGFQKTPETIQFGHAWHRLWKELGEGADEPAFFLALLETGMKINILPACYNDCSRFSQVKHLSHLVKPHMP